jgi:hypothetical protein
MKLRKILIISVSALILFATQQPVLANAVVATSENGMMFIADNTANTTQQNTKIALEGCSRMEGVGCHVLIEVAGSQAVARSNGAGGFSIVSDPDPQAAMTRSLQNCNKSYGNCKFSSLSWVPQTYFASLAISQPKEGGLPNTVFRYEYLSQEDANSEALKDCNEEPPGKCKIIVSHNARMFFARAKGNNYSSYGYGNTKNEATQYALDACKEGIPNDKKSCKISSLVENPGPSSPPKNFKTVYAKTLTAQQEQQEARSARNVELVSTQERRVVSCHNQCMNGDCIRTFPNGRKERWQAPRVYDSMSGDWKWETNSCGQ